MNEHLLPLFSFTFGIGLGVFFFGGLWLTMNRLAGSKSPILLTLGSFLFRSAICISTISRSTSFRGGDQDG